MASPSRIVLTRQKESNKPWIQRLEADGYRVLDLPLLCFEKINVPVGFEPKEFDWLLFTSPQGVRAFADAGLRPDSNRIATLGKGTRTVLTEFGWADDLCADCLDGVELAHTFSQAVKAPAKLLLPGPERRMADPRKSLETAGFTVTELPLYRTLSLSPDSLPVAPFLSEDIVFFCSPSTVRAFAEIWKDRPFSVAIGETTAVEARKYGFPTAVAKSPNLDAMMKAMTQTSSEPQKPETKS